ncbi:forespore capture DNA-binding protein RefZ [Alteribacillus sp. HJP-4]|uniref:forespore capture DNA-binding protein RefZ n=1 Tax=Alteribacillus sp. HJP-4 TaxID=2775394 RepID=UPI0035CD1E7B
MEAAALLFNSKGFHGTSVREIAAKAKMNVSLVSYYFGGKHGLLERLMVEFLEGYIKKLEEAIKSKHENALEKLLDMTYKGLDYLQDKHLRSRFVLREMTLDSMLIREITTTYLMKEKHLYSIVLKMGVQERVFSSVAPQWAFMHIRGMVIMPFLHPQYIREVFHLQPQEQHFMAIYKKEIRKWVTNALAVPEVKEVQRPGKAKNRTAAKEVVM